MKKISRRNVIVTLASTAAFLCPAVLKAATTADLSSWANIPTDSPAGLSKILQLGSGPASIDISELKADVTVVSRRITRQTMRQPGKHSLSRRCEEIKTTLL